MTQPIDITTIPFVAIESSNLQGVYYDEPAQFLYLRFKNGRVYRYYDVPADVYKGLVESESAGRYLHGHIRDKFPTEELGLLKVDDELATDQK